VLGFVADEFGLRNALIFPLAITLIAAVVAPRIGRVPAAPCCRPRGTPRNSRDVR
jgi:hypothetical protein